MIETFASLSGSKSPDSRPMPPKHLAGAWHALAVVGSVTAALGCGARTELNAAGALLGDGDASGDARGAQCGSHTAIAVSVGVVHACAILSDHTVKCWGGDYREHGTYYDVMPACIPGLAGVTSISAGVEHTCAVIADGRIECWGNNEFGKLGNGSTDTSWTPVTVDGLSGRARAVAAGGGSTCALLDDGSVECWGDNSDGELGDGTRTSRLTPAPVDGLWLHDVTAIANGGWGSDASACALRSTGTVECWGGNTYGTLGDGTTRGRSVPRPVRGLRARAVAVAVGAALLEDGTVEGWGWEAGDGSSQPQLAPVLIPGLEHVVALSPLGHCAVLEGGTAECWGPNAFGQIGDGTTTDRLSPVPVPGLSVVTSVASRDRTTCALMQGGSLGCWGDNSLGQIGDGTTIQRLTPAPVEGL
jgi:alpha-tubulin suppressor-like RCC1 family protein